MLISGVFEFTGSAHQRKEYFHLQNYKSFLLSIFKFNKPAKLETREYSFSFLSEWVEGLLTYTFMIREVIKMVVELSELGIHVPNLKEVCQYFERHPRLIELTKKLAILAYEKLSDAVLSLEIYKDPEIYDEFPVIYVRSKNYNEKIIEEIEKVRKEFYSYLENEEDWPLLTTDFRNP